MRRPNPETSIVTRGMLELKLPSIITLNGRPIAYRIIVVDDHELKGICYRDLTKRSSYGLYDLHWYLLFEKVAKHLKEYYSSEGVIWHFEDGREGYGAARGLSGEASAFRSRVLKTILDYG